MNSTLNEQALEKLNPFPPARALATQSTEAPPRFESGKAVTRTSVPTLPEKRIIQIRFERELPLPVAIVHQLHEARINAFRCFGINE
jgi:hypothetical protein